MSDSTQQENLQEVQAGVRAAVAGLRQEANRGLAVSGLPPVLGPSNLTITVNGGTSVSSVKSPQSVFGGYASTFKPEPQQQANQGPAPSNTPTPGA